MNAPIIPPATASQSVSLEKVGLGKRQTVDRDGHKEERERGDGRRHGADPDHADARPGGGPVGHGLQDLETAARHRNEPQLHSHVTLSRARPEGAKKNARRTARPIDIA